MGRGIELSNAGKAYGYRAAGNNNETLRWGQNAIDDVLMRSAAGHDSDTLWADFDDEGLGGAVAHEAVPGYYDSGAGWFITIDDEWTLAGITWTTLIHYANGHDGDPEYSEAWFRQKSNPSVLAPDPMDAIRISSYDGWITELLDGSAMGDLNWSGTVDVFDLAGLANNYGITSGASWSKGDFNGDGAVNVMDLAQLANHYYFGTGTDAETIFSAGGTPVPEPAAAMMLVLGLPLTLLRRRHRHVRGRLPDPF